MMDQTRRSWESNSSFQAIQKGGEPQWHLKSTKFAIPYCQIQRSSQDKGIHHYAKRITVCCLLWCWFCSTGIKSRPSSKPPENFLIEIFLAVFFFPKVFALQAEALMKLQRHEEADSILSNAPKFGVEELIKFFGAPGNAYFLIVQAQVDMAAGR